MNFKRLAIDTHDQWTFTPFSSTQSKSPYREVKARSDNYDEAELQTR